MKKVKIRLTENSKRIINMMEKPIVDEMIKAIQRIKRQQTGNKTAYVCKRIYGK